MNPLTGESWKERSRQILDRAREYEFKETEDGTLLKAHLFLPEGEPEGLRPAMIFFANSLWDKANVTQFGPQALHFAERGMVTVLAEYRTSSAHGASPLEAMSDVRSAIRWVRYNAEVLRVDPSRIVAVGGSGAAQMILAAALIPGVADDPNDPKISCVPDALVLFSPVVDLTVKGWGFGERFRDAEEVSRCNPFIYIGKHMPPSMIFHGTEDRVVPYEPVMKFVKVAKKKDNVVELCLFTGRSHSFYNFNVNPDGFDTTLTETDRFLVKQGFLSESDASEEAGEWVSGGWGM